MVKVLPGDVCPKTGIWVPSNNSCFYPADYAERVMKRKFNEGEIIPQTPHGESSWIFQETGTPLMNFTGLSPEQITERIERNKAE